MNPMPVDKFIKTNRTLFFPTPDPPYKRRPVPFWKSIPRWRILLPESGREPREDRTRRPRKQA